MKNEPKRQTVAVNLTSAEARCIVRMTVRLENEISTTSLSWCARPLVARLRQKMNKALKRNGEVPE